MKGNKKIYVFNEKRKSSLPYTIPAKIRIWNKKNIPAAIPHTKKEGLRYKPNKIGIVFLYVENYKTPMKEIKYLTKWRDIPCL